MAKRKIQYSLRALVIFAFVLAIPTWQIGKLRNQFFVERSHVANLKMTVPTASVEYKSMAPNWIQNTRFCPEWLNRVHSVDFIGLLENDLVEMDSVIFSDVTYSSIKSDLERFKSLDNLLLWHTQVSDETLKHISELTQVNRLDLTDCDMVTDTGTDRLIEKRPDLKITEAVSENGFTTLRTISPLD